MNPPMIRRWLLVVATLMGLFLLPCAPALATVDINSTRFSIDRFTLEQRIDPTNSASSAAAVASLPQKTVPNAYSLGYSDPHAVWHTIRLHNRTANPVEYVLYNRMWYNFREIHVEITTDDGTVVTSYAAVHGRGHLNQHRAGEFPDLYDAVLGPGEQQNLHIKTVREDGFSSAYYYRVMDRHSAMESIAREQAMIAAMLAVLVTLLIYNAFFLATTKAVIYLHYVSYLLCTSIINAVFVTGVAFRYTDVPASIVPWIGALIPLSGIFLLLASREILGTREHFPRSDRFLKIACFISAFLMLTVVFPSMWQGTMLILMILSAGVVWVGAYITFKGHRFGIFFLISTGSYLLLANWGIALHMGMVSPGFVAFNSLLIGSVVECFGLSLIVAYRLKEQMTENAHLEVLSTTDELTRLPNRRSTMARFKSAFDQGRSAIFLIDIDHFKRINDTFGHDTGDVALVHVAQVLKEAGDVIGRVGGEEFLAVMEDVTAHELAARAEALRAAIAARTFRDGIDITVSIGGTLQLEADHEMGQMMKRADLALYAAKDNGRNRVEMR
ncbi:MAG: GGDEF domain-containing protein [Rhodoferax sp.]|nr:GGDEF domain-containing protein [Rhodoferax sp.]